MNTLVDPQDGGLQVPETRDESASAPSEASTATLVELAPESGHTLILPEGPARELKRALTDLRPGSTATLVQTSPATPLSVGVVRRWRARAQALIAPDPPRLKRLAPFAVGVASLLVTGIPLWMRSPRLPATGPAPATMSSVPIAPLVASPPAVDLPADDREAKPAADPAAEAATAVATRGGVRPVGSRLAGDRRGRLRAGFGARWKSRTLVLRTRNGSPVVD